MPIQEARTAFNNFSGLAPDLEQAIFSSEAERRKQSQLQATATIGAAKATGAVAVMNAEIIAAEQAQHQQLLQAVGLDINDPNSMLNEELRREQTVRREREALDQRITEMESVNFFQNPLQFLMVQSELQQSVAKYNNLARTENRATSEIARMQSLATTIRSITPAKTADLLRARAVQEAEQVRQSAEATAAQISAQNAAGHAKAMLDAYTLRRNLFSDILQMTQVEESMADRRQRMEDQNFWKNIQRMDRLEKEEEKKKAKEQETAIVTGINLYKRAISGNAKEFTIDDVKRMPAPIRDAWFGVVFRGNYGNNYSQAVPLIEEFGDMASAANSGNAGMMLQVRNIRNEAQKLLPTIKNTYSSQNMGKQLKDSEAMELALKQLYEQDRTMAIKGADRSAMPPSSPYALDWESLAQQAAKQPKQGLVGEILVSAKARNPGANLTAAMTARGFFEEVQARVVAGKVDPRTAAEETARFFALQTAQNYEAAGLKYLALPQMVDYTITPGARGNQKVDLMNPTQIEAFLTAQAAAQRRVNSMSTIHKGLEHWMGKK
jgi:hypothetical protein